MAAPRSFIVLDPFAGSGTTIIAAEKTRRLARVIEMDPIYVDVAIRRWQKLTKKTAILAGTQLTFFQIKADATECTAANCGVETEQ